MRISHRRLLILAGLIAACGLGLPSSASQAQTPSSVLEIALKLAKEDPNQALTYLIDEADKGDAEAAIVLSELYLRGVMVGKDEARAFKYANQAAMKGLHQAQFAVAAHYYLPGVGVAHSQSSAVTWLKVAVRNGNADAGDLLLDMAAKMAERRRCAEDLVAARGYISKWIDMKTVFIHQGAGGTVDVLEIIGGSNADPIRVHAASFDRLVSRQVHIFTIADYGKLLRTNAAVAQTAADLKRQCLTPSPQLGY